MSGSLQRVLWMPLSQPWRAPSERERCCASMAAALHHACDMHADPFQCPDAVLVYNEPFDEHGVPVRDGGMSYVLIDNCPWCGTRLPSSQRDGWFDAVEAAGLDPDADGLPERFLTAAWRS